VPDASQIELNDVYAQFADAALIISKYIDYRNTQPFKVQLDRMAKQQQALELLNKIIEQPFVTTDDKAYSLRELNTYVSDWFASGKLQTQEAVAVLEQAGFIARDEQRYKLTSRGAALTIIAQEANLVVQRVGQLDKFVNTYKASDKAPSWQIEVTNPKARRAYKLIEDLQLPKLILDDQVIALRNYYQENVFNPTRAIVPLNKEQLQDLAAVLDILNARNNGKPVDRALEIFLEYKLEKPAETPSVEKILELRATGNTRLALEVTPMTLRQGIGSLTNQMGSRINELYTYVSLETQKKLTQARQKSSFVGKIGSVIAGIWGYATLKRVFGGSGLGSFSLPYIGTIGEAVSLAGGALLGAGLWKLVSGIEPSTEELKALNAELETHGVKPIKIGESWRAQAKAWVKEFVQTDLEAKLPLYTLLFQTGYLTIKSYNSALQAYTLGYPNEEVRLSLSTHLMGILVNKDKEEVNAAIFALRNALDTNNMELFYTHFQSLLADIPHDIYVENEAYFHSLFHLFAKLLGLDVQSEIHTSVGRIDLVVITKKHVYIFEFKFNKTGQKALEQIQDRRYYEKYLESKKPITLVGLSFNYSDKKLVLDKVSEAL